MIGAGASDIAAGVLAVSADAADLADTAAAAPAAAASPATPAPAATAAVVVLTLLVLLVALSASRPRAAAGLAAASCGTGAAAAAASSCASPAADNKAPGYQQSRAATQRVKNARAGVCVHTAMLPATSNCCCLIKVYLGGDDARTGKQSQPDTETQGRVASDGGWQRLWTRFTDTHT